jgi:hypothetical protein
MDEIIEILELQTKSLQCLIEANKTLMESLSIVNESITITNERLNELEEAYARLISKG